MNSKAVFCLLLVWISTAFARPRHNCNDCNDCCNHKPTCFPPDAVVYTHDGPLKMKDLELGTEVLAMEIASKELVYSPVITIMHLDEDMFANYTVFETTDGHVITLTQDHLIFKGDGFEMPNTPVFASKVNEGDTLFVTANGKLEPRVVSKASMKEVKGVYSPLTMEGTVIVDGVLASCYGTFNNHHLAHKGFGPLRFLYHVLPSSLHTKPRGGLCWYTQLLQTFGALVLDEKDFYQVMEDTGAAQYDGINGIVSIEQHVTNIEF